MEDIYKDYLVGAKEKASMDDQEGKFSKAPRKRRKLRNEMTPEEKSHVGETFQYNAVELALRRKGLC